MRWKSRNPGSRTHGAGVSVFEVLAIEGDHATVESVDKNAPGCYRFRGWYERGIAVRWRMKAVSDGLDDLLDRIDAIAARYGI